MSQSNSCCSSEEKGDSYFPEKLCVFCLKTFTFSSENCETSNRFLTSNRDDKKGSKNGIMVKRFLENITRYLGERDIIKMSRFDESRPDFLQEKLHKLLVCCDDCVLMAHSFCNLYHDLKCLELRLEWKMKTLIEIMKSANKVPSRQHNLNKIFTQFGDNEWNLDTVKKFRNNIITKCSKRLSKSQPHVLITRLEDDITSDKENSCTSDLPQQDELKVEPLEYKPFLLGWIVTFTAVVVLGFGEGREVENENTKMLFGSAVNNNEIELTDLDDLMIDTSAEADNPIAITDDESSTTHTENSSSCPESILGEPQTEQLDSISENNYKDVTVSITEIKFTANSVNEDYSDEEVKTANDGNPYYLRDSNKLSYKSVDKESSTSDSESSDCSSIEQPIMNIKMEEDAGVVQCRGGFICNVCSQKFWTASTLHRHMKNHSNDNKEISHCDDIVASNAQPGTDIETTPQIKSRPKRFRCKFDGCRKTANSKMSMQKHRKLHKRGQYECGFCDVIETNLIKLSTHEMEMHSKPPKVIRGKILIRCPRCPSRFQIRFAYQKHFAETHIWPSKDMTDGKNVVVGKIEKLKCNLCPKSFWNTFFLRRHMRRIHGYKNGRFYSSKSATLENQPDLKCSKSNCSESFEHMESLKNHEKCHGNFKCQFCNLEETYAPKLAIHEIEHVLATENLPKNSKQTTRKCSRCEFKYASKSIYIRHFLEEHLNIEKFEFQICPICNFKGKGIEKRYLDSHMNRMHKTEGLHPSEIQRCDKCPAYFGKRRLLLTHISKVHLKGKCPVCCKTYKDVWKLRVHLRVNHPKFETFPQLVCCDLENCIKIFSTKAELESHKEKDHHTVQYLKCSECPKQFKSKYKLTAHIKTVHVTPTFLCPECGKAFKTNGALKGHLEYHKAPEEWKYECPTCSKKVPDKQKLEQHIRTHTKEKAFVCQFCGKKIAHQHNWIHHLKTQHNQEFEAIKDTICAKTLETGNRISRKGSKKGDCLLTGKQLKHSSPVLNEAYEQLNAEGMMKF